MRRRQWCLLSLLALGVFSTASLAQEATTKPKDVLSLVPSSSIGFMMVNNVSDTGAKVDKFIADIGLHEVIQGNILEMLKTMLMVQAGLNENGGLAVCMLDPSQYGWDIPKMISSEEKEEQPGPLPIAFIIPGSNPTEIFANYQPETEDGYVKITAGGDFYYAKASGDYTVLSLTKKVVDTVLESKESISTKMSQQHLSVAGKADLAVYMDMKAVSPMILAGMERLEKSLPTSMPATGPSHEHGAMAMERRFPPHLVHFYMDFYKDAVQQLDAVTIALRFSSTGLLVDEPATFKPDSLYGRALASLKVTGQPMLDKLPALPYVLAIGAIEAQPADPQVREQLEAKRQQIMDQLLAMDFMAKVTPETKAKLTETNKVMKDQVEQVQVYAGGATPNVGVFGFSETLKVKNAETVRTATADMMPAIGEIIKSVIGQLKAEAGKESDAELFTMAYNKDVTKVEGASVDAIDVQCPAQSKDTAKLAKILGEDKFRIYIATVDEHTMVMSIGGAEPFLAEAIKAARNGGPVGSSPEVVAAMKELPENPLAVVMLNPANLLEVIKAGHQIMTGKEMESMPWSVISIKTQAPIAIGVAADGPGVHNTLYIPTALVSEAVRNIMEMQGGGPSSVAPQGSSESGAMPTLPEK